MWFKVDDGMPFHPKFIRCSTQAIGSWTLMGAWSGQQLTDGLVPDQMLPALRVTDSDISELAAVGLIERSGDGWQMHDFAEYNPASEDVKAKREADRLRQQEWRAKKAAEREAERSRNAKGQFDKKVSQRLSQRDKQCDSQRMSQRLSPSASPEPRPDPTRPDPDATRPGGFKGGSTTPGPTTTPVPITSADAPAHRTDTQTLIGEWLDHCTTRPPSRVIGQTTKEIKTLIDDGFTTDQIRPGLARWAAKGLHPSTLPSIVNETLNTTPARGGQPNEDAFLAAMARAAERDRQENLA